jgi:sulfatase modifying factor 1
MRRTRMALALVGLFTSAAGCSALLGDFSVGNAPVALDGSVDGAGDESLKPSVDAEADGSVGGDSSGGGACDSGAKDCLGGSARACVAGQWQTTPCTDDKPYCLGGDCSTPPSCGSLLSQCGTGTTHTCCNAPIAQGATFNRFNNASFPAKVSDVRIGRFEVSVARFRAFVAAGQGITSNPPATGAGAHPKIPNSGWQASYDASLLASTATLESTLTACAGFPNANYAPAGSIGSNNKPINCVTFQEALAFCIWDGGRLPTVAELELATRAGSEQRPFPWGAAALDAAHAFYCASKAPGAGPCVAAPDAPGMRDVGSLPAGAGKWNQLDLFGSMREYTLDIYTPMPAMCTDCAQLDTSAASTHGAVGGSWTDNGDAWPSIYNVSPTTSVNPRTPAGGFRCAYDL